MGKFGVTITFWVFNMKSIPPEELSPSKYKQPLIVRVPIAEVDIPKAGIVTV